MKSIDIEDKITKAYEFAKEKHKGQLRRGGKPYITHPFAVAEILKKKGYGVDYIITAYLHDTLEDTDATEDEILSIGGEDVLEAVLLLTKEQGYNMDDYIRRIKENDIAFTVKAADRLHNLQSATEADDKFIKRYITETEKYYLDFSDDIKKALNQLKIHLRGDEL